MVEPELAEQAIARLVAGRTGRPGDSPGAVAGRLERGQRLVAQEQPFVVPDIAEVVGKAGAGLGPSAVASRVSSGLAMRAGEQHTKTAAVGLAASKWFEVVALAELVSALGTSSSPWNRTC